MFAALGRGGLTYDSGVAENRGILSRPAPPPDLTVRYGPHPDQVADVRLPAADDPAPLVLLWHGGFWRPQWDRAHLGPAAADLAECGMVTANVEYRRTGWPTTVTDVAAAADTVVGLLERAAPGRVDQSRIVYAGHSAGGHLALWAALRHRLPAPAPGRLDSAPRLAGVLALAPVADLAEAYRLDLDRGAVEAFLGGGPQDVPDRYAAVDPAALGAPAAPVVLVHGDRDDRVPVEMSRRYLALTACRLVELPGADHFALIDPESAVWPQVLEALRSLID
jgi:acetyl esterase/lipase